MFAMGLMAYIEQPITINYFYMLAMFWPSM